MFPLRKSNRPHALLEKPEVFPKVDNAKVISCIFLGIFNSEIKPFVVAFTIGIIMNKENVVIGLC